MKRKFGCLFSVISLFSLFVLIISACTLGMSYFFDIYTIFNILGWSIGVFIFSALILFIIGYGLDSNNNR